MSTNRMYRAVGKVFVLNSRKEIGDFLDGQQSDKAKAEEQFKGKKVCKHVLELGPLPRLVWVCCYRIACFSARPAC
jgi:hypothetical protein